MTQPSNTTASASSAALTTAATHTTLDVRVLFSESGTTRTFSFPRAVTISHLRQIVERDAADLLSASKNRFFLDMSGRELKDSQQIPDNSTELTELTIFSSDVKPRQIQIAATPQLQVPSLSSVPPLSLPTTTLSAQPTSRQLYEYLQTFHALGVQLEFVRRVSVERYNELDQLVGRLTGMIAAFRSLCSRLHFADNEFATGITALRQQYDQQKLEQDELIPSIDADLEDLRCTYLHPIHISLDDKQHKLIDVLPAHYTSASLHQSATHARNSLAPVQKPIEDLSADYTNKVNLKLMTPDQNILVEFDSLQAELKHVKSLLDELDASTLRHNDFTQQLASSLSSGDPAALTASLNECVRHGTVKELRQKPASTTSYEAIREAHHHCLTFCSAVSAAIADRLEVLGVIKVLGSRKKLHVDLILRIKLQFRPVREVHYFREAYEAALRETIRRRDFDTQLAACINKDNDEVRSLCEAELASRSQFASRHLEFLNTRLFPGITDVPEFTPMIKGHFDEKLPNIGRADCMDRSWIDIDVSPNSDFRSGHKQQQQPQSPQFPQSPNGTQASNSDDLDQLDGSSVVSDSQTPEEILQMLAQNAQKPEFQTQIEDLQRQLAEKEQRISELNAIVEEHTHTEEQLQQQLNQEIVAKDSLQQQFTETKTALQAKFDQELARLSSMLASRSDDLKKKEALNVRLIQEDAQKAAARTQLQTDFQRLQTQCEQLGQEIKAANEALADAHRAASQQAEQFARRVSAKDNELQTMSSALKSEVKSLAEALSAISAERESIEQELQQKTVLICDLNGNIEAITTELQSLNSECADLTAERDSLVTARAVLISERDHIAEHRDLLVAEVDRLSSQLTASQRSLSDSKSQCTHLTQDLAAQLSEKTRAETQLADCLDEVKEANERIAALTEERDQLQADLRKMGLSTDLERVTSKAESTRLSDELKQTKQIVERLQAEIAEKDRRIQSAHNQIGALEKALQVTEAQNTLLTTESATRMSALELLRKESAQAARLNTEQLSSKQSEIDSLKRELRSVDTQLAEYKSNLTRSRAELAETCARVTQLTQTADNLSKELAAANQRLSDAKATIQRLEQSNAKTQLDTVIAERNAMQEQLTRATAQIENLAREVNVKTNQLNAAAAERNAMQEQLTRATAQIENLAREVNVKTKQLNATAAELKSKQEQLTHATAQIENLTHELHTQTLQCAAAGERMSNFERQCMIAHEQAHQAKESLAHCAGGLSRIATALHLTAHANAMRRIEADRNPMIADTRNHVNAIVDEFTHFAEESDEIAAAMRTQNSLLDPTRMSIKLSNFMLGDKILFLPLPGCRPNEQQFFAMCQDTNAPPSFLYEESLNLRSGTNSSIRQSSYLLGEFYHADRMTAEANNPYRLPAGAPYNLIQARLF